jgi:adenosylmethionine-8-amino-7-oxononanoate aminotransferase
MDEERVAVDGASAVEIESDAVAVSGRAARPSGHVWLHFGDLARYDAGDVPVIVRGHGAHVYDSKGRAYFDGLSALYCVNVGHGRKRIGDAMSAQASQLAFFPVWQAVNPATEALADKVASLAPGDLDRVFFTSGGSESIESAWKLVRQYYALRGSPGKTGIISRAGAYHGTSMGALSITGIPSLQEPFRPLVPGVRNARRVDAYHAEETAVEHSIACAEDIAAIVEREGADSIGAVIVEPIQNAGGCLVAEPEYFARVRSICDANDLLLISDETICSWGRLGAWFGCSVFGYQPDIVTTAKGMTSGYAPMGAMIVSERIAEAFVHAGEPFSHGFTFGGHPVAAAAALENLALLEEEGLLATAVSRGQVFREALESLRTIPLVGDVRGQAMFQAVELVADQQTRAPLSAEQLAVLSSRLPARLFERGLVCRAMNRGGPIIQFAPTLVSTDEELARAADTLGDALTELCPEVL